MADFIEVIKSITTNKKDVFAGNYESYPKFMIDRWASNFQDLLPTALFSTMYPDADPEWIYHLYLDGVPKKNRFARRPKIIKDETMIEYLCRRFRCGKNDAEQMVNVLPKETLEKYKVQIERMNETYQKVKKQKVTKKIK